MMKMRKRVLSFLLALAASVGAMADDVPSITVEYVATGTPHYIQAINAIGYIEFDNNQNAILHFNNASLPTKNLGKLSSIDKIIFTGDKSKPNEVVAISTTHTVSVYPNPTANHIHIDGLAEGEAVHIFSTDGRLVLSGAEADYDLGALPKGVYLLQVGVEVVKIIKK